MNIDFDYLFGVCIVIIAGAALFSGFMAILVDWLNTRKERVNIQSEVKK